MKNPRVVIAIIVVIAGIGFGAYTISQNTSKSDSMMKKDEEMIVQDDAFIQPTDAMMKKDDSVTVYENKLDNKMVGSRYVQYSKSVFDSASNSRRVLFFYASWCPTCKPADANFTQKVSNIPEDVTLIRVNYNDPETDQEEKDLAKKYGVTYQHTFVQIDGTGKEVSKWNGGQLDELLSNIK